MKFSQRRKLLENSYRFSYLLSVILHPALLPTWIIGLLFFGHFQVYSISLVLKWQLLAMTFIATAALPFSLLKVLEGFGLITDFQMRSRQSRIRPFLILGIYYTLPILLFVLYIKAGDTINLIMLAFGLIMLCSVVLNFFYKVSIHALGIGGALGMLLGMQLRLGISFFEYIIACILLGGLLMSARLRLKAHSSFQVWTGFFIGLATCLALFYFFGLS